MDYIRIVAESPYTPLIIAVIIFLSLFYTMFRLVSFVIEKNLIKKSAVDFYSKTQKEGDKRKEAEEILKEEEGMQEKIGFFSKFDNLITYSNIRKYFPFMNAEIYILLTVIISSLTFFIVVAFAHWLIAILFMITAMMIMFAIIFIMANINYTKIENSIMTFVNLMENYSKTSDDIVSIIGKIAKYVDEPLRTALEECYAQCLSTGNTTLAFENLSRKISHGKFREIIRNITICSRYEANYGEIVSESRNMLRYYLLDKKEKKALLNNARVELFLIVSCSMMMMWMVDGFTSKGLVTVLTGNVVGIGILAYNIAVLTLAICSVMFSGSSHDD